MNIEEVKNSDIRFLLGGTKLKEQWDWLIEQAEKVKQLERVNLIAIHLMTDEQLLKLSKLLGK